jgi:hypothetical protein
VQDVGVGVQGVVEGRWEGVIGEGGVGGEEFGGWWWGLRGRWGGWGGERDVPAVVDAS